MELPKHLGIIPDGNRRWAKGRNLPSLEGHRRGVAAFKEICYAALDRGVEYITYYAFSTENWNRTPDEVKYLMELFVEKMTSDLDEVSRVGARLRVLGSRDGLSPKLVKAIENAEERTASNTRGTMAFCLNYGGEEELAQAYSKLMKSGVKADEVTPEVISKYLYAPDIPPLDLVIRTSGERRLSGFMLWRSSYAELYFADKHWPEFGAADLDLALADFASRKRRFGR